MTKRTVKARAFILATVVFVAVSVCLFLGLSDGTAAHAADLTITEQPADSHNLVTYGRGNITLNIEATSSEVISYEWFFKAEGAMYFVAVSTEKTLVLTSPEQNGQYYCKVTAGEDILFSNEVTASFVKANVRVAVESKEIYYGDEDAPLTYVLRSSLVGNDTVDDLGITLSREAGIKAGTYAINFSSESKKYTVEFFEGTYKILPREVDIVVSSPVSTFGEEIKSLSWEIAAGDSLAYDDVPSDLNVRLEKAPGNDAGRYPVTATYDNSNYALNFRAATYTIEPIMLDARLVGANSLYYSGATPEIECELIGEYSSSLRATLTFNRAVKDAGDYVAMVHLNSGNYGVYNKELPFTVKKAPLTISFRDVVVVVGEKIEAEFLYGGFMGEEDESVLKSLPYLPVDSSQAGVFEVLPMGAEADNYVISYRPAKVQVNISTITSGTAVVTGSFAPGSTIDVAAGGDSSSFGRLDRYVVYSLSIQGDAAGRYTAKVSEVGSFFPLFLRATIVDDEGISHQLVSFNIKEGVMTVTSDYTGVVVVYYDLLTPALILAALIVVVLIIVLIHLKDRRKYRKAYTGHWKARKYAEEMIALGKEQENQ